MYFMMMQTLGENMIQNFGLIITDKLITIIHNGSATIIADQIMTCQIKRVKLNFFPWN